MAIPPLPRTVFGRRAAFALLAACLPVMAPAPARAGDGVTVSGTVAYRERIALPPDAEVIVRIQDVSRADAPAKVVAELWEPLGQRQVPIPFSLEVPRSAIEARASYVVRATILVGGKLRFTTDRRYPVLVDGRQDKPVSLLLVGVRSAPPRAPGSGTPTPR